MLIRSSNEQTFFPVSIRVINSLEVFNEFASASCVNPQLFRALRTLSPNAF